MELDCEGGAAPFASKGQQNVAGPSPEVVTKLAWTDVIAFVMALAALALGAGGLAFGGAAYRDVRALRDELSEKRRTPG